MEQQQFTYLFHRYFSKQATPEETETFFNYVRSAEHDDELKQLILQTWDAQIPNYPQSEENADTIFNNIISMAASQTKVKTMILWRRIAVAASILLVVGLGSYLLFFNKPGKQNEIVNIEPSKDVQAPQATKATITLADGRIVTLDSVTSGTLATQGNIKVTKTKDGQVIYDRSQLIAQSSQLLYNTLFNPRGSKVVSLTLDDGTKVWLNSESSLTYPTAFTANERKVEITGEAYFEVARDAKKKFIVTGNGVTTEVLGTHFNVNTYDDEQEIKVTLLEGKVKVTATNSQLTAQDSRVLAPGQQAVLTHDSRLTTHGSVDTEAVMAWKNGLFTFKAADIKTIMRQVARWYDVEIVYEKEVTEKFYADVSRNTNISTLLKMLETTKSVHFRVEGKKVTVMK